MSYSHQVEGVTVVAVWICETCGTLLDTSEPMDDLRCKTCGAHYQVTVLDARVYAVTRGERSGQG